MNIVVGNEKGGVGKSMLAINVAAAIQQTGPSVALVDTDSTATTSGWAVIRRYNKIEPEITVVAAPDHPERVLIGLASQYDNLVIDVGARDYTKLATLAKIADFWLAPTQVSQGDMDSTLKLYDAIRSFGRHHPNGKVPFAVVLNRTPVAWNSAEEAEAREYMTQIAPDIVICQQTLRERRSWRDVGKSGHTLLELPRRDSAKAIDEFAALFQEMITLMTSAGSPSAVLA